MSFDTLAPFYRFMERLAAGGRMQRARTQFLEGIPVPRRILTLGEGHGPFLLECRRLFPEASIMYVDSSSAMLSQARLALARNDLDDTRIEWALADVFTWEPPRGKFDLIATHFFLDCFTEAQIQALIPRLTGAAAGGASWLLADFQIAPQGGWRRARSQIILAMLYAFFRAATGLSARRLVEPDACLRAAGWRLHGRIEHDWSLLRSDWWLPGSAVTEPC